MFCSLLCWLDLASFSGITSIFYSVMVQRLWRNQHRLSRAISPSAITAKRRITSMVAAVTVTFALCWLPENVWFLWRSVIYPRKMVTSELWLGLQISAQLLAYTNSCLNPILYGILSKHFRHGFQNIVGLMLLKKQRYQLTRIDSSRARRRSSATSGRLFSTLLHSSRTSRRGTDSHGSNTPFLSQPRQRFKSDLGQIQEDI